MRVNDPVLLQTTTDYRVYGQRVSHFGEDFDGVRLVHANHRRVRAGRAPAMEHARRGKAGEDADQRHAAGRGHVLPGGVVANVKAAAGDDLREAGETPLPEGGAGAGLRSTARSTRAASSPPAPLSITSGQAGGEQREEFALRKGRGCAWRDFRRLPGSRRYTSAVEQAGGLSYGDIRLRRARRPESPAPIGRPGRAG